MSTIKEEKPIGNILGDLIAILLNKNVLTLEETITIVGEEIFNRCLKKGLETGGEEENGS